MSLLTELAIVGLIMLVLRFLWVHSTEICVIIVLCLVIGLLGTGAEWLSQYWPWLNDWLNSQIKPY